MSQPKRYTTKHGSYILLTPTNFPQWRQCMQYLLIGAGVWEIVNGTEVEPAAPAAGSAAAIARHREELKEFRK